MTYQLSRMQANGSRISEARDTGSSKPSRTHTSTAAPFPWAWERYWAADPASTRWSGLAVTRATGTSLHQKQGTLRGATNRCLIFIAASRTGRGHLIQDIAEPADRYLSSRCRIRTRPLQPCLREYARLGFRFLKIKTAGSCRVRMRIRDGKRQSVFRSYVFPYMDRPNLTVLPHALVTRLTF